MGSKLVLLPSLQGYVKVSVIYKGRHSSLVPLLGFNTLPKGKENGQEGSCKYLKCYSQVYHGLLRLLWVGLEINNHLESFMLGNDIQFGNRK